jgi:3-phenylpropionate/cinnamic acid dioxygenase small subunit
MSDEEGIRRTIAEFCQFLDDRRFEDWSNLFTEAGEFQDLKGRAEILRYILGDQLATIPELKRKHTISNIIIDVSGDEATAVSDLVIFDRMGDEPWIYRVGDYTDHLVREGGRWLFAKRQLVLMD